MIFVWYQSVLTIVNYKNVRSNASSLIDIHLPCYPILKIVPKVKAYLFIRFIPLIHSIRDNFEKIAACLTMLLDAGIKITPYYTTTHVGQDLCPTLGIARLGIDSVIGSAVKDGEMDISLCITPKQAAHPIDYPFIEKQRDLARQLCDYFFGAQYVVTIQYTVEDTAHSSILAGQSMLGYGLCV
jgi:predicted component of type VI protein secretion system